MMMYVKSKFCSPVHIGTVCSPVHIGTVCKVSY